MRLLVIGLVGLLAGCSQSAPDGSTPEPDTATCPEQVSPAYVDIEAQENLYDAYEAINFRIHRIEAEADTVTFQSRDRNFVYCRGDGSWTIQPGTDTETDEYEYAEPPYQTIQLNEQSYQYRVLFDPIPTSDSTKEPQQVVFELILPQQEQPVRQVLYTLEQAKQLETAVSLGVPQVTAAVTYDNRLFWAVSPEQGEGNGGVATIVSFKPQSAVEVIQPEAINAQQINDLAIAGEPDNPTFWIATQRMGEGNPYVPGMGLVAYRPDTSDYQTGSIELYHVRNSPMVGAIPTELEVEGDELWVGTGNGVCQVQWQSADNLRSWRCWRLALMSELPEEVPLYTSLLAETPQANLAGDTAEVLWWSPQSYAEGSTGRYEVQYSEGFTVTLEEQGVSLADPAPWEAPVYWAGWQWHWRGDRFERGLDEVSLSAFGGGPTGISVPRSNNNPPVPLNHHAMRGDLELLKLTQDTTQVKYYSGWVEDEFLKPYLILVPQEIQNQEPNPLTAIAAQL